MKIEGPGRADPAKGAGKKTGASKSGETAFSDMVSGGPRPAAGAAAGQSIAQIDALLALQGAEDPSSKATKKRMQARADNLLDRLESMRHALLSGNLTVGHLIDIADVVASHREKISDPHLTAVLDEIDLRAQIELAKLRRALDTPG
ncbi:MAG: flagellar assembly protein FliX [Alphaproteobacteria bacterium]|nr:flagellar assembly protein FliX [Alphaproteobacteria bacterium]